MLMVFHMTNVFACPLLLLHGVYHNFIPMCLLIVQNRVTYNSAKPMINTNYSVLC